MDGYLQQKKCEKLGNNLRKKHQETPSFVLKLLHMSQSLIDKHVISAPLEG